MPDDLLYPPPPAALVKPGLKHLANYMGPGVIIASVTIGSGELVWASRSGAIFGYRMLWCFLYAGVFKAIQVYTASRHITLTGQHPIASWRHLPGPTLWFPLLIAVPAVALMPIAFSALPEMLGGFVHRLTGMSATGAAVGPWEHLEFWINIWSTLVLVFCLALALGSSYAMLERVSIAVLGVMVTCMIVSVLMLGPKLSEMLTGLFVPWVGDYPEWIRTSPEYAEEFAGRSPWLEVSLYLSAVGGGAYDYIGYVGMVRRKGWGLAGRRVVARYELDAAVRGAGSAAGQTLERAKQWARAPLFDTAISFFFVILVTLLFTILGRLVLHERSVVPANNNLLAEQEMFLTQVHPELRWLYRVGVFLALIGTLYGAFEVYRHTFVESVSAIFPAKIVSDRIGAIRGGVVAYCFVGGLLMLWLPTSIAGSIIERMTFGTIVSGAASCGLWCFAMLWIDHTQLPPQLRMGRPMKVLTAVAGIAMTVLGIQTTIAYFS